MIECPKCKEQVKRLTIDHIVPDWLVKRIDLFQVNLIIVGNKERICADCNIDKGGIVDYKDPRVKKFIKEFVIQLEEKVND